MSPDDATKIAAQIAVRHVENVNLLATAYPFRSLPRLVEIAQTSLAADIAKALQCADKGRAQQ